jgi:adenosylcobalamin-dependent ribonucleoside-diphosphate reductase
VEVNVAVETQTQSKKIELEGAHRAGRSQQAGGLTVERRFTAPGEDPLETTVYEKRDSAISNSDGSTVFELKGAEVPVGWSQLATDIAVSKYFRKAGLNGDKNSGERSVRQLVYRISHSLREAGDQFGGYFADKTAADNFEAELSHLLVDQKAAFNSPVWFNCGLYQRYGIEGQGGNWYWDAKADQMMETTNAYEHPQCSACFIQAVEDDLMAIYEVVRNEARLFKYGSGTGSNFSAIRGRQEKLSGGGTSSGLMSFLEVFDRAAGSTKSGGTTRRAAKMVCLDLDHPEIEDFIDWKVREEKKARALIAAGYDNDFNGEAYRTVSGQNSNNSVRVTDDFMRAVEADGDWQTRFRTTGETCDTLKARHLWKKISEAAWWCADPGVQYDTTINDWHTCPNTDRINASNPCSEYMFLDDSACNLASINLTKFLSDEGHFDVDGYRQAVRVLMIAMDIIIDYASYPTRRIAKNSHDYRPLGLGYANLGTMLMRLGIPYDSDQGRGIAGALTAIMCGHAYATSAEVAAAKGAFNGFQRNRIAMLRVMNKHRDAAYQVGDPNWVAMRTGEDPKVPAYLLEGGARGLGSGLHARRAVRLPQLAEHGAGAHGHHRPAHGLRHHGHRARLRAGEVQEAGRRRPLQDREPERALGPQEPGLHRGAGHRHRVVRHGHQHLHQRAARGPQGAAEQGPHGARDREGREGAPRRVRRVAGAGALGAGHRGPRPAGRPRQELQRAGLQPAASLGLHARAAARDQRRHRGSHDHRGRPAPARRAPSRVRLRQPLRQDRQALHRADGARLHDGGRAALPLGRHLEDRQHAQRVDGGRGQAGLHGGLEAGPQGHRPLPRRQQEQPAAQQQGRRAGGERRGQGRAGSRREAGEARAPHGRSGGPAPARDASSSPAQEAQRLHAGGAHRWPQGLPAHR